MVEEDTGRWLKNITRDLEDTDVAGRLVWSVMDERAVFLPRRPSIPIPLCFIK